MAPKQGALPKSHPGPWGVAGLPPRAVPSHRFRLPITTSSSSWGGSPLSLRRFQSPPVRPTSTTSTMQRSSPRQPAVQLARPRQPVQPAAPVQRSRPTLQVEPVVTSTKHQETPRSFVGPRASDGSDSDEPLVPRRRDAPKVSQYSRGSASRADEVHRDILAVRRLVRGKMRSHPLGLLGHGLNGGHHAQKCGALLHSPLRQTRFGWRLHCSSKPDTDRRPDICAVLSAGT